MAEIDRGDVRPVGRGLKLAAVVLSAFAVAGSVDALAHHTIAPTGWTEAGWLGFQILTGALVIAWRNRLVSATRTEDGIAAGALILMAILLSFCLLVRLPLLGVDDNYGAPFFAWLVAMALFASAMTLPWRRPNLEPDRAVIALLSSIVLTAAVLRLWRLGSIPYVFNGDESAFALWAEGLSGFANPFGFGYMSQPTLGIMLQGVVMKVAGHSEAGSRLVWALTGAVSMIPAYLLANRIGGRLFGLGVAACLALYHFHIHYSRMALNNIADPFFMCVALWCLIAGIERKSNLAWTGVGVACGLALYFYQGARLTLPVVAAVLAYASIFQGRAFRREALRGAVIALGAFLISAGPMILSAIRFPQDFNARINQISIFAPGWLEAQRLASGRSTFEILWDQLVHAALAFNWYPDQSEFYGLDVPLLDPVFGGLFAVGLIYATAKALISPRHWVLLTIVIWWWGGMLSGGAMTLSPPSSQRLLTLSFPVCAFIVVAIFAVCDLAARFAPKLPKAPILAACIAVFGASSLKTYFIDFSAKYRPGSYHGVLATELARMLKRDGNVDEVYLVGRPNLFWDFPTFRFLAAGQKGQDIGGPLRTPPPRTLVEDGQDVLFVVLPHNRGDLALIRDAFPDGESGVLPNPLDAGTPLADLYRVAR